MKIDLYITCPICLSEGLNSAREYWRHAGRCQGVFCIDEKAMIHCRGCRKTAHVTQMRLMCGNGRHTFEIPSVEGYAAAISTSASLTNEGGLAWLQSVINSLSR